MGLPKHGTWVLIAVMALAITLCRSAAKAQSLGKDQVRDPDRPRSVTVRVAELPYKRNAAPAQGSLPGTAATATLQWDGRPVVCPLDITPAEHSPKVADLVGEVVHNTDDGEKLGAGLIAELGERADSALLRDLGWSLAFISSSHTTAISWYEASVASASRTLAAGEEQQGQKASLAILKSVRAKLYTMNRWDSILTMCDAAIAKQAYYEIDDEFWWRIYRAQALLYRNAAGDLKLAGAEIDEVNKRFDALADQRAVNERLWISGLVYHRNHRFSEAVEFFDKAAKAPKFGHARDAARYLVYSSANAGQASRASRALSDFRETYGRDDTDDAIMAAAVAKAGGQKNE